MFETDDDDLMFFDGDDSMFDQNDDDFIFDDDDNYLTDPNDDDLLFDSDDKDLLEEGWLYGHNVYRDYENGGIWYDGYYCADAIDYEEAEMEYWNTH